MRDERRRTAEIRHRFQRIVAELHAQDEELEALRREHAVEPGRGAAIPESLVALFDELNGEVRTPRAHRARFAPPHGFVLRA